MDSITFEKIPKNHINDVVELFNFLKKAKIENNFDACQLIEKLGDKYHTIFIHTKQESDEWLAKWKLNNTIEMPWDFGSWVDAIKECEVELISININNDGTGKIFFNQLCHPTVGIEALAEIVLIYKAGNVVINAI
ncbi:hypothetical protein [Pseudoalteromonas rubra]|uniref:Uncharacterized protein n=1 Tax=Pseudoalteromonas rubra TaxID=43658 RepID=A0A0F4Q7R5_9GAMM|nr:hypothetical protein [Pseudoalteromonas rubra]KJZ03678.1 hypothetical protein TW77_23855 [Pseudoalteromonas rubra]